ncbi:hypothetical protein [Roseimicrobium sp. ORNL1]|uniref:hypothetical protein n=1 Tax=Roseimicrobium sp. ORNL1 TaxID=2711231 RepID=UPI0013E1203B|nr:hypothetical protein [Roseimicrobium sp. ORNL1]QIF04412.1 hypothetical protein G5S37_23765 [Roseimicrobium sp. ORNL1]
MKKLFSMMGALMALALAGCLPKERIWWSPDGSQALVTLGDGLHLAKSDGSAPVKLALDVGKGDDPDSQMSWLPDGSGFVTNRVLSFSTWEAAKAKLPADEASEVERLARSIPLIVAAWNAAHAQEADGDSSSSVTDWLPIKNKELLGAAIFLAHATQRDALEAELLKSPKGKEVVDGLRDEKVEFSVHEISVVKIKDGKVEGEPRSLARSLRGLIQPKVSPLGKLVAFHHIEPEGESAKLVVAMLDGSARLDVAHETSGAFDWTTDGRALVYTAPVMSKENNMLQRIQRIEVTKSDGSLRSERTGEEKNPDELQGSVNLALALMPTSPRVVALPDGRVLFASQPVSFPAKGEGLEVALQLFTVTADGKTLTPVPTAPGDLPANLGWFTASPDGRKVAVVESDTDAVAVVEIDSGKTEIISPVHPDWQCRTMPSWKSATELTFAALKDGAPKWMLWKQGEGVRSISDTWPAEATKKWLEEKKKEQPAEKTP